MITGARPRCSCCAGSGYDALARAAGHAAMAAERRAFSALRATLKTVQDDLRRASDALQEL